MIASLLSVIAWVAGLLLALAVVLMAMNKQSGLKILQHRPDMLAQAMLVRYVALAVLALFGAWFGAPRLLFAMLLTLALVGFGDAFVYRRAGHPHWLHLAVGGAAAVGALLALFAIE